MADRRGLNRALGVALGGILAALVVSERAAAVSAYLSPSNALYSETRLESCGVCQATDAWGGSAFGTEIDVISSRAQDPIGALLSLHEVDAIGDDSLGATEIEALFLSGRSCGRLPEWSDGIRAEAGRGSPWEALAATTSIACL